MLDTKHLSAEELEAGLEAIRRSPREAGTLELIVCRPRVDEREALPEARLDLTEGLVGDNWRPRGSSATADGSAHPDKQVTLMNARTIALLAQDKDRWQLAGDQLFLDMDLSFDNLPPGARLALGSAVLEVTQPPHTGCKKFSARFGLEALKFVNSPEGKQLRLRGMYAKIIQPGLIRVGDMARKVAMPLE